MPVVDFTFFLALGEASIFPVLSNCFVPRTTDFATPLSSPPTMAAAKAPLTSKKYIDGIYIPAGLLVMGVAISKRDWLPYAVVLTLILGAIKFLRTRESTARPSRPCRGIGS